MERPLYIFDLDDTLSLTAHRQDLLTDKESAACWKAFDLAAEFDPPNSPVIMLFNQLLGRASVQIWSGRGMVADEITAAWLLKHTELRSYELPLVLKLRPTDNREPGAVLKRGWLHKLWPMHRARLTMAFDDDPEAIAMWQAEGVATAQITPSKR